MDALRTRHAAALLLTFGLAITACADDDTATSAPTTAGEVNLAAYCDGSLAVERYFSAEPDVDFATASDDEIAAALSAYLEGALPVVQGVLPHVPEEIRPAVDIQVGALEDAIAAGDPDVATSDEATAAVDEIHAFDLSNCDWASVDVTAVDYAFEGIPTELAAGVTSFELTNNGADLHEIVLLRKNDGVTAGFDEILALEQAEAQTMVTPAGGTVIGPTGASEYAVVDLAPGEYTAVCFIPQGVTGEDGPPPAGPPHFVLGMHVEFTVANA